MIVINLQLLINRISLQSDPTCVPTFSYIEPHKRCTKLSDQKVVTGRDVLMRWYQYL